MDAAAVAFVVVFLAELGDKSQLVALGLATRYRVWLVLVGIGVAFSVTQGLAALAGGALGAALPTTVVGIGAAVAFFGFAIWTWRDAEEEADPEVLVPRGDGLRSLVGVIGALMIAEFGDKTMIATATLAADRGPLGTWVGATLGATASAALAVVIGRFVGSRLPERATRRMSAALFAVFGVLLLIEVLR